MKKRYEINKHNSTVCGYPGRGFDWTLFDWNGETLHEGIGASLPWVDDGLIGKGSQYLHVPYEWTNLGTIYRVRPNESMRAGETYRGHKVIRQRAVQDGGKWYWELEFD